MIDPFPGSGRHTFHSLPVPCVLQLPETKDGGWWSRFTQGSVSTYHICRVPWRLFVKWQECRQPKYLPKLVLRCIS